MAEIRARRTGDVATFVMGQAVDDVVYDVAGTARFTIRGDGHLVLCECRGDDFPSLQRFVKRDVAVMAIGHLKSPLDQSPDPQVRAIRGTEVLEVFNIGLSMKHVEIGFDVTTIDSREEK